jgi:thioredoxin 1
MAINELRKKSPAIWLYLFIFLLLGLSTSMASLENAQMQMTFNASKNAVDFPENPVEVDDKNLDQMLKNYSLFVVDCWEMGCRPCELIDPTINEMARDLKDRVAFGKLCIDENAITKNRYDVSRTPTLLIFKNGTLVFKNIGNYPKQKLEEIILTVLRMR